MRTYVYDELTDHSHILLHIITTSIPKQTVYDRKITIDFDSVDEFLKKKISSDLYSSTDGIHAALILTGKLGNFIYQHYKIIITIWLENILFYYH